MKIYYVTMDDGKFLHFRSDSAANAIGRALGEHLGHRVIGCFVGGFDALGNANHHSYPGGRTDFVIPPHEPLTQRPAAEHGLRPRKRPAELFDDASLVAESKTAAAKAALAFDNELRALEALGPKDDGSGDLEDTSDAEHR